VHTVVTGPPAVPGQASEGTDALVRAGPVGCSRRVDGPRVGPLPDGRSEAMPAGTVATVAVVAVGVPATKGTGTKGAGRPAPPVRNSSPPPHPHPGRGSPSCAPALPPVRPARW